MIRRGEHHPRWNRNGYAISKHGYKRVRVGVSHPMADSKGYTYEHRLVMVGFLGRPLEESEVVHHKNGDRTDNRIENLELTDKTRHAKAHAPAIQRDPKGRFLPQGHDQPMAGRGGSSGT